MKVSEIREVLLQYSTLNENIKSYCDSLKHVEFNIDSLTIGDKNIDDIKALNKLLKESTDKELEVKSIYDVIINLKKFNDFNNIEENIDNVHNRIVRHNKKVVSVKDKIHKKYMFTNKFFMILGIVVFILLLTLITISIVFYITSKKENEWYDLAIIIVGAIGSVADVAGIFFTIREIKDDKMKEITDDITPIDFDFNELMTKIDKIKEDCVKNGNTIGDFYGNSNVSKQVYIETMNVGKE